MKPTQHKKGFWAKYSRFLATFLAIVSVSRGIFYLFVGIYTLTNVSHYGYMAFQNSIVYFVYYSLVIPLFWMYVYLFFVDIDTDDEGLHIKIFIKPITIKWNEIKEVKSVILFGLFERPNKKIVLIKSKFPFIFRVAGLLQGKTFSPSLRINSSISDYSVLMKRISKAARQNQRLAKKNQANK